MNQPLVTVAILNWNGRNWLEKFLPSVLASTYPNLDILLIDNASTDDSVAWTRKTHPSVRVEVLDDNYGFAGGYNRSMAFVEASYVVLLNSDVEVPPAWLEPLVKLAESDDRIASIQPKILAHHAQDTFEYAGAAGGYMDVLGYPFCRGRIFDTVEQDIGQHQSVEDIFWATGACCLLRMSVVREIGLFEARFFAHMEEIDFCWRAKNLGYRIMVEPASHVFHVGGGALPQGNPRKTYLNARNSLFCLLRNLPAGQVFPKIFTRMLLDGVWGLKSLFSLDFGSFGAILKAHAHFYGGLAYHRRMRKQIYKQQTPRKGLSGFWHKSVVWHYFVRGKKTFNDLMKA
ncbi:MAG: glycosyltransferase family 2 protein [Bacteroidota bacterium]